MQASKKKQTFTLYWCNVILSEWLVGLSDKEFDFSFWNKMIQWNKHLDNDWDVAFVTLCKFILAPP